MSRVDIREWEDGDLMRYSVMHEGGTDIYSEIRGWPKHDDQGRRRVESVG